MNCTEFEFESQRAVETRNSLAAAAIEHLTSCAGCRHSWELQQQLNETIAAWRMVQPSAGLTESVLAELMVPVEIPTDSFPKSSPRSTPAGGARVAVQKSKSAALALTAVAACMIIAALFASRIGGNIGHELARTHPGQTIVVARSEAPLDVSGTLTEVFSDLKTEYREMANETTAMAREMVIAIPRSIEGTAIPESDTLELLPNSTDMVRMLQPIGSRVESAFGFLWNTIPSQLPSG